MFLSVFLFKGDCVSPSLAVFHPNQNAHISHFDFNWVHSFYLILLCWNLLTLLSFLIMCFLLIYLRGVLKELCNFVWKSTIEIKFIIIIIIQKKKRKVKGKSWLNTH